MLVNLESKFVWTCPDCGYQNVLGNYSLDPELLDQLKDELELTDDDEVFRIPDTVFCRKCETEHTIAD